MEGNFINKNLKPTLSTPSKAGKQVDTYFKKQMKPTGMSIKESQILTEKEESLKKKIFKLDKMETLVHTDEYLSKIFSDMKLDAAEQYGYHWNETILNIIFNDYVLNSPKYLDKYKNTRAKAKTRRGEEGIAQLQNDIDKEKEVTSGAEERKQNLMKKSEKDTEEVDEGIMDTLLGRGNQVNLPVSQLSKNDTYFVDTKNNRLIAHVPYSAKPEEKQAIIQKNVGNPSVKQLSWYDAVTKGVKGVPKEVADGSIDQMKGEFDKKYAKQGGVQAIPALTEDGEIGKKFKISDGSGLDSNKIVTVVDPKNVKTDGTGVPTNVSGAYKPIDWKKEVAIQYEDGSIGTMFKSRLTPVVSEDGSGSYSMGLDAQNGLGNKIADQTYQNETTTSASSGQYSGKAIWSKDGKPAANKPAWKGGLIVSESVINGDLDYFTDPKAFKKYILQNQIAELLTENVNMDEAESIKQQSEKLLKKYKETLEKNPELIDNKDFMDGMNLNDFRSKTGKAYPSEMQTSTVPTERVAETTDSEQYEEVVFMQGDEAQEPLQILKDQGQDAALEYLKQWHDVGNHMGSNELPHGSSDQTYDKDGYHMAWNDSIGYIGLTYDTTHGKSIDEHHLHDNESKIQFILNNTPDDGSSYDEEQLHSMGDEELDRLYKSIEQKMGLTEGEDKSEVYYAIEMMLRPTDSSLTHSELQDISNEYGVDFEDVVQTMSQVLGDRENRKGDDAREIVADAMKELGHNHEKTVTLEELKQYIFSNYDSNEIDNDQLEVAYEKMTTDPNQLSMFEQKEDENYKAAMKDDLKYSGKKVTANASADELENKDGLFKDKWNTNEEKMFEQLLSRTKKQLNEMYSDPEVGEDRYKEEESVNNYMSLEAQSKELAQLRNAGNVEALKAKIDSLPMIPMVGHSGRGDDGLGHRDLEELGYVKVELEMEQTGEDEYNEGGLYVVNTSNKPIAQLDDYRHSFEIIKPGDSEMDESVGLNESYVEYFKEMQGEPQFKSRGNTYQYVWAKYPDGKIDIGVYDIANDLVIDYEYFRKQHGIDENNIHESMIDDQPDSMINPQADSIAASMDSDELNKDGVPVAGAASAPVEEGFDDDNVGSTFNKQAEIDANDFRANLKAKYGVDSIDQLSNIERAELIKSMNFDGDKKEKVPMNFKRSDADVAEYRGRDEKRLAYLSQYADRVNSVDDYFELAKNFKAETGENMHVPMAILASIQALPQGSELRNKLTNIEKVLQPNMKESVNEERKTSSILNVEKLGRENHKNFKSDLADSDAVDQDKTYPKDDGIHKAPVYPNPKDFYIEQDLDKVQREAKSMADIEKEVLKKSKGSLNNIGDATADGKNIPKRNLTKEEGYALAMNRGDGMQDIVYDNKPSDKFEKRMEQDLGKEVYKARQDKMDYKKDAPMYNKDTQPTENGDKKEQDNKFIKGYNSESITGKYKDEFNKFKLFEFKLGEVEIVESVNEDAFRLSTDGMGNKFTHIGKEINENAGYEDASTKYDFYLIENKVYAIVKGTETKVEEKPKNINESFNKMKHLMNYKPHTYVDTKKSVKF